jgi:hypothetical protein
MIALFMLDDTVATKLYLSTEISQPLLLELSNNIYFLVLVGGQLDSLPGLVAWEPPRLILRN